MPEDKKVKSQPKKEIPKKDGPVIRLKPEYLKRAESGESIIPAQKFRSFDGKLRGTANSQAIPLKTLVKYPLYKAKEYGLLFTHFEGDLEEAAKLTLSEAVLLDRKRLS